MKEEREKGRSIGRQNGTTTWRRPNASPGLWGKLRDWAWGRSVLRLREGRWRMGMMSMGTGDRAVNERAVAREMRVERGY